MTTVELEDVIKRAKFRMECAKRTGGADLAWFMLDEIEQRKPNPRRQNPSSALTP